MILELKADGKDVASKVRGDFPAANMSSLWGFVRVPEYRIYLT
jgi:hypothetical protein